MRPISPKVKASLLAEPDVCARKSDGDCAGRITWEHALLYAGQQIDEVWAIIKICEYHHAVNRFQDGGGLDKRKNQWIALNRATDEELQKYPRANFIELRNRLNKEYEN